MNGRMYWSTSGRIACSVHAPPVGCDTWIHQGWAAVTAESLADWLAQTGAPMQCEVCTYGHGGTMARAPGAAEALVEKMFPGGKWA